jgi:choline kinase
MRAVVLAGGKGTRLAPYTRILPKPLMPVGDMPILEVLLRQMKRAGVEEAVRIAADWPEHVRRVVLYVRHHGFLTDLDALFWTFVIMIPRLGQKPVPELANYAVEMEK